MKPKPRLDWVDANKGIAIIIVVLYHAALGLESSGVLLDSTALGYFRVYATAIATPVFFLMSGLFIEKSVAKAGYRRYTKIALQFVLYPYFLWASLQILLKIVFASFVNKAESFDFLSLFYAAPAQFWFLHALFFAQILFMVMHKYHNRHYLPVAGVFMILSFAVFQITALADILRSFAFLLIGAQMARTHFLQNIRDVKFLFLSALILILSGPLYLYYAVPFGFDGISNFIGGIAATILLSGAFIRYGTPPVLQVLGKYSMYIFVMHIMCLVPVRILILKLGLDVPFLALILCSAAGLSLPVIAAAVLEKLKLAEYVGIKSVDYFWKSA